MGGVVVSEKIPITPEQLQDGSTEPTGHSFVTSQLQQIMAKWRGCCQTMEDEPHEVECQIAVREDLCRWVDEGGLL